MERPYPSCSFTLTCWNMSVMAGAKTAILNHEVTLARAWKMCVVCNCHGQERWLKGLDRQSQTESWECPMKEESVRNVHGNLEEQGQDMTVDGWACAVTGQTLASPSWTGAWIGMHWKLHATLDIYAGEQRGSGFLYTRTSSFILQL